MNWKIIGYIGQCYQDKCHHQEKTNCLNCTTWQYHWEILNRMPQLTPYGWKKGNVPTTNRLPIIKKQTIQLELFNN